MVPVFDISLIGTLTAIWGVAKVIFGALNRGIDWIAKKALTLLIGSKLWATAFFFSLCGIVVGFFYKLVDFVVRQFVVPNFTSLAFDEDTFTIMSYLFDLSAFTDCLNFVLSLFLSYLAITKTAFVFRALLRLYTVITQAWKT